MSNTDTKQKTKDLYINTKHYTENKRYIYQYKTLHRKLKIYISIQDTKQKTKDLYINTKHYTEN